MVLLSDINDMEQMDDIANLCASGVDGRSEQGKVTRHGAEDCYVKRKKKKKISVIPRLLRKSLTTHLVTGCKLKTANMWDL